MVENVVDVARLPDDRGIELEEVGISDLKLPITVKDRENETQHTIGIFNAFVKLPATEKGTHMSRLVEILYKNRKNINHDGMCTSSWELCERLEAPESRIDVSFPYYVRRISPVSAAENLMIYNARFTAIQNKKTGKYTFKLGVSVKVGSVCPCAKELCQETGASHAQRGLIEIDIATNKWIWLEQLIEIAEQAGSVPLYARLKRPDEKHVVLQGFANPKFVEDICRDAAVLLHDLPVNGFRVKVTNFEQIHQHNAVAKKYFNWNAD